jgi:hypothetical protein
MASPGNVLSRHKNSVGFEMKGDSKCPAVVYDRLSEKSSLVRKHHFFWEPFFLSLKIEPTTSHHSFVLHGSQE